jgi:hypothetical protein
LPSGAYRAVTASLRPPGSTGRRRPDPRRRSAAQRGSRSGRVRVRERGQCCQGSLPRSGQAVRLSGLDTRRPRCAGPSDAPKRTRTSTQLAWTRPSTWQPGCHIRPHRARTSDPSRHLDAIDTSDGMDVVTSVVTDCSLSRSRSLPPALLARRPVRACDTRASRSPKPGASGSAALARSSRLRTRDVISRTEKRRGCTPFPLACSSTEKGAAPRSRAI